MQSNFRSTLSGSIMMLAAALSWGGMYPVAKATLAHMDAFYMTMIRYGTTAIILLLVLYVVEGRKAFAVGPRWPALLLYSTVGFSGFGLLVFTGLRSSTPEHGAIFVALMPLLTAIVTALLARRAPTVGTMICIVIALVGVATVVSNGQLNQLLHSSSASADLMMFTGVLSWVIYTLGLRRFSGWSPLRYSCLTVAFGMPGILLFTLVADHEGLASAPSLATISAVLPQLIYIVIFASIIAVLGWNAGIQKLGPVNGVLFINFVPVTAFIVQAVRGAPVSSAELAGGAFVVVALVLNSALQRRPLLNV